MSLNILCLCGILLNHLNCFADEQSGSQQVNSKSVAEFYLKEVKPILKQKCYACHAAIKREGGLRLDTVSLMHQGGESGKIIVPGDIKKSEIWKRITAKAEERMPPDGEPLTRSQLSHIKKWIQQGAHSPVKEQPEIDPADHWAYQPLSQKSDQSQSALQSVDQFIDRKLKQHSLTRSPPADAVTLVRRLFLDLHGLPPQPQDLHKWVPQLKNKSNAAREHAVSKLIDFLLASPRYGERWGQHWLDVTRYADTHGFEVNTSRPNAWPYRDYVIESFNSDKPYHQFIFEQLAGDSVGMDSATGFLVTAPVLLPGQIGKDDASKRLARQDALNEIIVNMGATFLGLTVGCARCHDHKFDPITQKDYYALQAFFAGVHYGDREIFDEQRSRRLEHARQIEKKMLTLKTSLSQFQPITFPGKTIMIDDEDATRVTKLVMPGGVEVNSPGAGRGFRSDSGSASHFQNISQGKFTWWNQRKKQDVFTWNPTADGVFHLWVSWGVHGNNNSTDARYLIDRDGNVKTTADQTEVARVDQTLVSGKQSRSSAKESRWSGLHYAGKHQFTNNSRLLLRGGSTGAVISADVIVMQEAIPTNLSPASHSKPQRLRIPMLRDAVNAKRNSELFKPRDAMFVRFTILQTIDNNRHAPCIDEFEIYASDNPTHNLALAANGALVTSTGDNQGGGKHQLKYVNDGKYGNGSSWISHAAGRGLLQIKLPQQYRINKIVWGRDRTGKYQDRLAIKYKLETSRDGKFWQVVATSDDRFPQGTITKPYNTLLRYLTQEKHHEVSNKIRELKAFEKQIKSLSTPRKVYGGQFRKPTVTTLLHRGDPEQPGEIVKPNVPELFGSVSLESNSTEQSRRVALANWIIKGKHPLTARVLVNRVWQYHFGTGIVETSSDFGLNGGKPSHPQLLDWLARKFIKEGGSIKQLHRLILMSHTYQQSSIAHVEGNHQDAQCRLLWRFPSRRLESEAIRDSILSVSGNLNLKMGGPGFNFFKSRGGLNGFPILEKLTKNEWRRMIYAHKIRMEPVPVFGAFDCPDAGQAMPRRTQSVTAIQALNLFNSSFVIQQSEIFAKRIRSEAGSHPVKQMEQAFLLGLGRLPSAAERTAMQPLVNNQDLATLCRVIFNTNEFVFLP